MMEHSQPVSQETPSNVSGFTCPQTGLGLGLRKPSTARQGIAQQCPEREGQRPRAPRKQAGHTSASDQCQNQLQICLALQQLSTQDIELRCALRNSYCSFAVQPVNI